MATTQIHIWFSFSLYSLKFNKLVDWELIDCHFVVSVHIYLANNSNRLPCEPYTSPQCQRNKSNTKTGKRLFLLQFARHKFKKLPTSNNVNFYPSSYTKKACSNIVTVPPNFKLLCCRHEFSKMAISNNVILDTKFDVLRRRHNKQRKLVQKLLQWIRTLSFFVADLKSQKCLFRILLFWIQILTFFVVDI